MWLLRGEWEQGNVSVRISEGRAFLERVDVSWVKWVWRAFQHSPRKHWPCLFGSSKLVGAQGLTEWISRNWLAPKQNQIRTQPSQFTVQGSPLSLALPQDFKEQAYGRGWGVEMGLSYAFLFAPFHNWRWPRTIKINTSALKKEKSQWFSDISDTKFLFQYLDLPDVNASVC